jgi:glycosyltransferase involved in cell wall biosynthesis
MKEALEREGDRVKRRLLVLNQYFPPDVASTAKCVAQLANYLGRFFAVTVLAGRPSYSPTQRHPFYLLRHERVGNIVVERVGSTALPRYRMKWRLSNYLSYLTLALVRGLMIPTDIVLTMTDPPLACVVGALIARRWGCPFIYNIRDLHPDMALAAGLIRPGPLTERWEQLHRWALSQAVKVIVLGEDMKERLEAKGVLEEKIVVIHNWSDLYPLPPSNNPFKEELRCGFPFVAMHAGNLGFYGAWETLLKAAQWVAGEGIGLIFVGEGTYKAQLLAIADGAANVRFLPYRPEEQVPFVLASPDLHIVTIKHGFEGLVVPSKLYPILAAGKPVLAVVPERSEVAKIVRQARCGIVIDPADSKGVADALRWARYHADALQQMAHNARTAAAEFTSQKQMGKFVQVIQQTLS